MLFFLPAGEPLDTLLFYCYFLLDAATVGTDDVDTCDRDAGLDGLTWLYGEVANVEATHVGYAYIGLTLE